MFFYQIFLQTNYRIRQIYRVPSLLGWEGETAFGEGVESADSHFQIVVLSGESSEIHNLVQGVQRHQNIS